MSSNESEAKFRGRLDAVKIASLRLDDKNPRLSEKHLNKGQAHIADALRMAHDVLPIVQSLVENGFFVSEPLLVIENPDEADTWIVVEGNRRTTALLGLTNPEIREDFEDAKWDELATRSPFSANDEVPVVVHENREAVQIELAAFHGGGKVGRLDWLPYPRACWIRGRTEDGMTFEEIAHDLRVSVGKVRDDYRDLLVAEQARDMGAITTRQLENAYTLVTVAMKTTKLRDHIGVPSGGHVKVGESPVPEDKQDELKELVQWVFGGEDPVVEPKISDSRQMSKLGKVGGSEGGLRAIRGGDSLDKAEEKIRTSGMDPLDRLIKRLTAGRNALREATDDMTEFADNADVAELVDEIESIATGLYETVDEAKDLDPA